VTSPTTLDASQLTVASAPVEGRQIVLAGPGAGKTEVVGRMAERYIENGVYPDEILVISFSQAALAATKRRTGRITEEGQGIDLTTIDSLAARIVVEHDNGRSFRGFDDTVRRATALLAGSGWDLSPVAHVIVDEVQDVVGVRARFVLALLDALAAEGTGFTLLGDPLQGIYDFQLGRDTMTCTELLDAARHRFGAVERTLTGEYRTRSQQTAVAATVRAALTGLSLEQRLQRLDSITVNLPPLGALDADAVADISGWSGSTALLCDTNIRAALVAQQVTALGLPVETVPSRDDPGLASWIADLLQNYPDLTLSREQFLSLASTDVTQTWLQRWRLLLTVSRGRRDLSLRDLAQELQSVWRAGLLERPIDGEVVASTVHRAKGLEFDNVVLVDPDQWGRRDEDTADAASRRLFVALTRARSRLARVRGVDTRGWSRDSRALAQVWIKRQPRRGGRGRPTAVLLEPWMARSLGPSAVDLASTVGSALTWERADELVTVDGDVLPSWTGHLDDLTPVARTGEEFGRLVADLTDPTLTRLPLLTGGRVEGTETVPGPPLPGGPGRHGFWTGARVAGTITFTRNTKGLS